MNVKLSARRLSVQFLPLAPRDEQHQRLQIRTARTGSAFCACILASGLMEVGGSALAAEPLGGLSPEAALFSDFQTFCVATGAQEGAVGLAVDKAGAVSINRMQTDDPYPMTKAFWGHIAGNQRILVSAVRYHKPATGPLPATNGDQCTVASRADYQATLKLAHAWVGMGASMTSAGSATFDYQMKGSTRARLNPDNEALYRSALDGEGVWSLVVEKDDGGRTVVSVTRFRSAPSGMP